MICQNCGWKYPEDLYEACPSCGDKHGTDPDGLRPVFLEVWRRDPHICSNCGGSLGSDPKSWFFSHTVRRSRGKIYRNNPEYIELLCLKCHNLYDGNRDEEYEQRNGINKGEYVGGINPP